MKFKRINFNEIYEEFEIIEKIKLTSIKGGRNMPSDIVYGVSPDGFLMEKVGDGDWVITVIRIEEVELIADKPGFVWDNLYNMIFQNANWYSNGFYIGGGSGSGGNGGTGGSNGNNLIFNANVSDSVIYQAISWANASMGLALSQADASALALKVNLPSGFTIAGGVMTAIGSIDNAIQYYETGDWQDGVQSFLGLAATTAAFIPGGQGVAFVLGGVLFIWELAE